jgi:hypothetical protein
MAGKLGMGRQTRIDALRAPLRFGQRAEETPRDSAPGPRRERN